MDEELLEGQGEDEVADVPVELRVGRRERCAVLEEDPVVPLPDGLGSDDQRQHDDHGGAEPPGVGADHLLVPLDELVLGIE